MLKNRFLLFVFLSAGLSISVHSEDRCADIIEVAMSNSTYDSDESMRLAQLEMICSMTYDEHRSSFGGKARAKTLFWNTSGSAKYNQSTYDLFKSENCTNRTNQSASSSAIYHFQSYPDKNVVESWKACMQRETEGLSCWAEPETAEDVAYLVLNYKSDMGTLPVVDDSGLSQGKVMRNEIEMRYGGIFEKGTEIKRGTQRVRIQKTPYKDLDAHINISLDGSIKSCKIFIPRIYEEFRGNPRLEIDNMAVEITMSDWNGDWSKFEKEHREVVADRYCKHKGYSRAIRNEYEHFTDDKGKPILVKSIHFNRNSNTYNILDPSDSKYKYGGQSSLKYVSCKK